MNVFNGAPSDNRFPIDILNKARNVVSNSKLHNVTSVKGKTVKKICKEVFNYIKKALHLKNDKSNKVIVRVKINHVSKENLPNFVNKLVESSLNLSEKSSSLMKSKNPNVEKELLNVFEEFNSHRFQMQEIDAYLAKTYRENIPKEIGDNLSLLNSIINNGYAEIENYFNTYQENQSKNDIPKRVNKTLKPSKKLRNNASRQKQALKPAEKAKSSVLPKQTETLKPAEKVVLKGNPLAAKAKETLVSAGKVPSIGKELSVGAEETLVSAGKVPAIGNHFSVGAEQYEVLKSIAKVQAAGDFLSVDVKSYEDGEVTSYEERDISLPEFAPFEVHKGLLDLDKVVDRENRLAEKERIGLNFNEHFDSSQKPLLERIISALDAEEVVSKKVVAEKASSEEIVPEEVMFDEADYDEPSFEEKLENLATDIENLKNWMINNDKLVEFIDEFEALEGMEGMLEACDGEENLARLDRIFEEIRDITGGRTVREFPEEIGLAEADYDEPSFEEKLENLTMDVKNLKNWIIDSELVEFEEQFNMLEKMEGMLAACALEKNEENLAELDALYEEIRDITSGGSVEESSEEVGFDEGIYDLEAPIGDDIYAEEPVVDDVVAYEDSYSPKEMTSAELSSKIGKLKEWIEVYRGEDDSEFFQKEYDELTNIQNHLDAFESRFSLEELVARVSVLNSRVKTEVASIPLSDDFEEVRQELKNDILTTFNTAQADMLASEARMVAIDNRIARIRTLLASRSSLGEANMPKLNEMLNETLLQREATSKDSILNVTHMEYASFMENLRGNIDLMRQHLLTQPDSEATMKWSDELDGMELDLARLAKGPMRRQYLEDMEVIFNEIRQEILTNTGSLDS